VSQNLAKSSNNEELIDWPRWLNMVMKTPGALNIGVRNLMALQSLAPGLKPAVLIVWPYFSLHLTH